MVVRWQIQLAFFAVLSIGVGAGFYLALTDAIPRVLASDTTDTWDFVTSGDYTPSDANLLEVTGGVARLKVQNYTSDASTAALYHLDESGGTTAEDSSSNSNDGTVTDAVFGTGNLNNGLTFDGVRDNIAIPDSASLSLSQSNTLEVWTKFSSAFSAGSHAQRQGLLDKGDYQLYFDNETGKLTYELASNTATDWTQRAGNDLNNSWSQDGLSTVESTAIIGTDLYVGTGNGTGDAEVWRWNGSAWTKVGGDAVNSSWAINTFESVTSLVVDGSTLYAGIGNNAAGDGEVWSYNGTTWTKIGGDNINSGWGLSTFESVLSMYHDGSFLYVGLGTSANDAEVWRWNSSAWTKVGGDSLNSGWTTNFEGVYSLTGDGTYIYAGLGITAGDAEVWRCSNCGTTPSWTRIGGDAINSGWADATYEYAYSLTAFGGNLYAGLGATANDAEVWRWNGTSWSQIGGDSLNSGWTTNYELVYSLANDGTNLYAGLGNTAGDNEIWRWNGTSWTKIGGDGTGPTTTHAIVHTLTYSSGTLYVGVGGGSSATAGGQVWSYAASTWTLFGGDYVNNSWGFRGLQTVDVLNVVGDYLYAGTGNAVAGNAMVWRYDGSNWTLIGGQGVNSSWTANTFENVTSLIGHSGNLYAGLGTTANDAEVWMWNGTSWSQIGGDSLNSGWTTNFEEVNALASYGGFLYAGLGNSANDAEVWRWNGSAWTKVGGDSLNSGWTTNFERVQSLAVFNGDLVAGLGASAGDAEVWRCSNCGTTPSWTRIGGDAINSSWANTTYEQIESMIVYNNKLYVGLGNSTDDAEVWEWDGSAWVKIAGDDVNGSWTTGTYERVKTLAVYNGDLYAGLGNGTGDGEIWRYSTGVWSQVAGDSLNASFTSNVEEVQAFSAYKGKFYVGTGNTANADAMVWSFGNNSFVQSSTASFDTNWHHVAATYDGTTMRIYIDGVLDASLVSSVSLPDSGRAVLVGMTYAGREYGKPQGFFTGSLDEIRISTIARSSFVATPYANTRVTVQPTSAVRLTGVESWDNFSTTEVANGGTVTYRLSDDGGSTWKYWNGSAWVTSSGLTEANNVSDVNTNIGSFPVTDDGFLWQAVLLGNGNQLVTLDEVVMDSTSDLIVPTAPSSLTALNETAGLTSLTTNTWYGYTAPYFSWSGASDGGSGLWGYYVYFGTDNTADPQTAGTFQTGSSFVPSGLISGTTYYLRIRARDYAQNVSSIYAPFIYKLDSAGPQNPTGVTVAPTGYAATNDFTFYWTNTASDTGSGIAGYQYQVGASVNPGSWSSTTTALSVNLPGAAYQTGENFFYLRTLDNAGNVSSGTVQVAYYYAGTGPTAPQNVDVTPATNTTNSFAFSWDPPSSYSGDVDDLTYCYTVNTLPSEITCTFTSAGATSISAGAFATQVGTNTFYVVAKNDDSVGGAINYGAYDSATFTANTSAPGIPLNVEIADVSVKSTSSWKIALSWEPPSAGVVEDYEIYRSADGTTFTEAASTTGIAFVDTGLTQQTYYYKIRACDNVHNCGSFSTAVELLPTGRFTTAAELTTEPKVSLITTRSAVISWGTDRTSDSKIQYGKKARDYFSEEPSNSDQLTDHEISLSNLSPGTRYYFKAKWTDEDGNTGVSTEDSFETLPAPTVTDPKTKTVGLTNVVLEFTTQDANKAKIYYGTTASFGSVKEISTSTSKTTYNVTLDDLQDGTKYFYKVNTLDSEDEEYDGSVLTFETLPRPKISNVRIQQVRGSAQTVMLITWSTNTETSSIVTFYPDGRPDEAKDEVNVKLTKGDHRVMLRSLQPQTPYVLVVKGQDKAGNEALSDPQRFTTATDTRAPQVIDVNVEGTVSTKKTEGSDNPTEAQIIVSWTTDEASTSQVEYGEGTGSSYPQKTGQDDNLVTNHTVIISGLTPSKVYHLRVVSRDKAGNVGNSIDTVAITPKATANALDLVITSLRSILGQ